MRTDDKLTILVPFMLEDYIFTVSYLTRREQLVLCVILGLLLMGWTVKAYRKAHPPTQTMDQIKP